uniref:Uncharacterized protein n=1 Tax=Anguilla anguilla TaxID=7936 RepID=A0A0E9W217_ANGAN
MNRCMVILGAVMRFLGKNSSHANGGKKKINYRLPPSQRWGTTCTMFSKGALLCEYVLIR